MTDQPIAILDRVSYMYPRSDDMILSEISFEIKKKEFLGIIGPTGAGKTTLCLTLNGIVPQFYGGRFFGSVAVAGLDTLDNPISKLARHVSAVFQDPETQLIATSVENEIAFALENVGVPRDEILDRIPPVLEAVRLEGTEQKHPHELSGGQKQRLAIAAGLAMQPDLLILDEPTSQLDPIGAQEVFETVRELNKELGVTVVMASHASEEMAEHADRLLMISGGQITAMGAPDEIYSEIEMLEDSFLRPPQVARTFYMLNEKIGGIGHIPVKLQPGIDALSNVLPKADLKEMTFQGSKQALSDIPLISVQDLEHTYEDGTVALKGINTDIYEGEYVLIIGQNGAGKSTLVKHFLHLLEPTKGNVIISGTDSRELDVSDLARRIGYVAQNPDNQIFSSTVEQEVSFALKNLDYPDDVVEERTTRNLEAMGLLEFRDMHPLALPKGDRARIVIAAVLAMEPEVIIFDEPTTGQDYRGARYILDVSKQLHEMGKTVIVITHHLYLMPTYAERVLVMGKGTLLLDAHIRKAYHSVETLESTYLKPPQAVLLSQEISRQTGKHLPLLTPFEIADSFVPAVTMKGQA